jgi:FkbM family methyltransferase
MRRSCPESSLAAPASGHLRRSEIAIPPASAPLGSRLVLGALRGAPIGQFGQRLGCRIYNRLVRTLKQHRRMQTFYGAILDCDLCDLVGARIFHFGVWEPHISALIRSRLRPGDFFCDVGAHIGYHSLLGAASVGNFGRVVAIEPSPSVFSRLVRNLELNNAINIRPVRVAVTGEAGTLSLYRGGPRNTAMASTVRDYGFGRECDDVIALPLADILSADERARMRFLKIDVEGAELPILDELDRTIDHYSPELEISMDAVRCKTDYFVKVTEMFRRFSKHGFSAYSVPNSYDVLRDYLNLKGITSPIPIEGPAREQQDVLFSRSSDLA